MWQWDDVFEEIGEKIASSVFDYFRDKENIDLVNKLKHVGLLFQVQHIKKSTNKLNGASFVISGSFSVSREDLKDLIIQNGGKNTSSVSKKTDYLITGDNFGQKKKKMAIDFGVSIISELDFKKMLT